HPGEEPTKKETGTNWATSDRIPINSTGSSCCRWAQKKKVSVSYVTPLLMSPCAVSCTSREGQWSLACPPWASSPHTSVGCRLVTRNEAREAVTQGPGARGRAARRSPPV